MSRGKLFIENFLFFGGVQALNKMIPVIMLPIIAAFLTDPLEFGKYDMFSTLMNIGAAIATLGIYDATFREYFAGEKNTEEKRGITSTALNLVFLSSLVFMLVPMLFTGTLSRIFWGAPGYDALVILSCIGIFLHSNQTMVMMPIRLENRRKLYLFYMLLNSAAYYGLTLLFLNMRANGESLMYATLLSSLLLIIMLSGFNHRHFRLFRINREAGRELLRIGLPLVPVFIGFWLLQAVSKILISNMLGLDAQGIYSLGGRVATIATLLQIAYSTGFSYYAFSTMNDSDQVEHRTKLVKYLLIVCLLFFAAITALGPLIFGLLFSPAYAKAIIVFPYLFMSPLLFILYQTVANQFTIAKKTWIGSFILAAGVAVSVCVSYVMILHFGLKGGALGAWTGYFVILLLSIAVAGKMKMLHVSSEILLLIALALIAILLIFAGFWSEVITAAVLFLLISGLYYRSLFQMGSQLRAILLKKINK